VGEPGGLVQLDTVFVNLTPTRAIKHFTAYDPIAKWTVGKAFNRATAQAAARFLDKILADMPFPAKAIQVDGGSEFMAVPGLVPGSRPLDQRGRPLCPAAAKPANERRPRTLQRRSRYEFYETYGLSSGVNELNPILDSYQHLYNHHRPHGALAGKTPARYLANRSATRSLPSHMC
jgi:putative transposase